MLKIALLDGPIHPEFRIGDPNVSPAELHAQAVKSAILTTNPTVDVIAFPIFHNKLRTSRDIVVEALWAAMASDAQLLHCSFGFTSPDVASEKAFSDAVSRFEYVIASSPARGAPVYPASYQGVIKASGDARLSGREYSWLNTDQADFAADPRPPKGFSAAGASIGAARISGIISSIHADKSYPKETLTYLQETAKHYGGENKTG